MKQKLLVLYRNSENFLCRGPLPPCNLPSHSFRLARWSWAHTTTPPLFTLPPRGKSWFWACFFVLQRLLNHRFFQLHFYCPFPLWSSILSICLSVPGQGDWIVCVVHLKVSCLDCISKIKQIIVKKHTAYNYHIKFYSKWKIGNPLLISTWKP